MVFQRGGKREDAAETSRPRSRVRAARRHGTPPHLWTVREAPAETQLDEDDEDEDEDELRDLEDDEDETDLEDEDEDAEDPEPQDDEDQERGALLPIDGELELYEDDYPLALRDRIIYARGRLLDALEDAREHPVSETVARHAIYLVGGAGVLLRHWRDSRTGARYERALRQAEAIGDGEALLEWEARLADWRRDRHERRMDMLALPGELLLLAPRLLIGSGGLLLILGVLLAIATKDARQVFRPVTFLAETVQVSVHILKVIAEVGWFPALSAAFLAAMVVCWVVGRRQAVMPGWLQTAADADVDLEIDETTIARALAALRIPQITQYFKDGNLLQFITPARVDGRGTHAVIRLPAGVTAELISKRRAQLASGLSRAAKETWPSTGPEAGILDLWVADKGALAEGAGPYPLLNDGFTDVFKGVPFGKTLRGDPVTAPLIGRNTMIGGIPEQGKSSAARVIMAGVALDPTAELRIWVPDANYDFEVFRPRCSRYVMGAEDDRIEQILEDLTELQEEVQARGRLLIEYGEPEVTRKLANMGVGLHPLFCLLEECHVAFGHPVYGREIRRLYTENVKLCRKRGIHKIASTQAPTKDSIPRDVTRNCSVGIAFAVGDHVANDALLGQGAYRAGHRATELIPGTDRGTALCKGFSGQRSEIVQVHFLSVAREHDQVTPLIDRAMAEIERRGMSLPGSDRVERSAEQRDLWDDLDEVLGQETGRVNVNDLPARLRALAPTWAPYGQRQLTGKQLVARLKAAGVKVASPGGRPLLDPLDFRRFQAARATEDLDDWQGGE